jgi:hypothetical protein
MSVEFYEEDYTPAVYGREPQKPKKPGLVDWMVSKGIVKSESRALIVLISISILFLLASFVVFAGWNPFRSGNQEQVFDEDVYITISGVDKPVLVPAGQSVDEVIKRYER